MRTTRLRIIGVTGIIRRVGKLVRFDKHTRRLVTGNTLAQFIVFCLAPILARVYGPTHYGLFGLFTATFAAANVIVACTYEMAIPLAATDEEANQVMALCLCISFLVSLATLLLIVTCLLTLAKVHIFGGLVQGWINNSEIVDVFWFLPLSLLIRGLNVTLQSCAIREQRFQLLARISVLQTSVTTVAQLVLGIVGIQPLGLVMGFVTGQIAAATWFCCWFRKGRASLLFRTTPRQMSQVARTYRRFPQYYLASTLLNNLVLELPILIISRAGIQAVGWFTMAQRVLVQPLNVIGFAVSNVYYSETARFALSEPKRVRKLFWDTVRKIIVVGVVMMGTMAAISPWFFRIVFGTQWAESGRLVQVMAFPYLLMLVSITVSTSLVVARRQELLLIREIIRTVMFLIVWGIVVHASAGVMSIVVLFSITATIGYLLHISLSWLGLKSIKV